MKEKRNTKGNQGMELDMLVKLARKVNELKDEFEALSISKFCDGLFFEQFYAAQSRLEQILITDLCDPINTCVMESMVRNNKAAV